MNFHKFYEEKIKNPNNFNLFKKIGFKQTFDKDLMTDDQWECSFLYRTLRLRKVEGLDPKENDRKFKPSNYFKLIQ